MTQAISFAALRDNIIDGAAFQRACQRYANSGGSSEAIAMAVLTSVGFPDLHVDALRYRWMREHGVLTEAGSMVSGHALDQAVDAQMIWEPTP